MPDAHIPPTSQKRLIIVGGGFAGITLAKKLRNKKMQVVLLDRNNYHTFQPLLYQVATGGLEAESIAYPLRRIVRRGKNLYFRMAEVLEVIPDTHKLRTSIGTLQYDYLVMATGSQPNFFNFAPVQQELMPLKTVIEALNLRSYLLQNMETALLAESESEQEERMNIVIVGGGPTGVELAGALAEMRNKIFPKDYPELNFGRMHIFLFEAEPALLSMMSSGASKKAKEYLEKMRVNIHLNTRVKAYDGTHVMYGEGETIRADTLIWTAGVKGAALPGVSPSATVGGNRLAVDAFNRVKGYESIFALGDVAAMMDEAHPKGHPMLAQVAIQQAKNLAYNLVKGPPYRAFQYKDKGVMATIGRNKAVADLASVKFQGAFAWWLWMGVHLVSLAGFRNRLFTFTEWVWNYFSFEHALRLIIRPYRRTIVGKPKPK